MRVRTVWDAGTQSLETICEVSPNTVNGARKKSGENQVFDGNDERITGIKLLSRSPPKTR